MTDTAQKLPIPTLMLVTDRRRAGREDALVRAVAEAVDGGVNVVQLREKDLPSDSLLPLACRIREVTRGRALLLVNGPLDVALDSEADGVHLPEDAPMIARPSLGFLVGRSVHSVDAARKAVDEGVDYLVAGPVYGTASHPEAPAAGVELFARIAGESSVPVIAIGGITAQRAPEVILAGTAGVAVISAILDAPDYCDAAQELRGVLDAAWTGVRQVAP
jgi:thiamine-phosphate pyrophosphorylase